MLQRDAMSNGDSLPTTDDRSDDRSGDDGSSGNDGSDDGKF
jgi:hypothetical protein